jgi:hypothetical protein
MNMQRRMMRSLRRTVAAMLGAILLAGCGGIDDGVDMHLGAYHKGCIPASNSVSCTGD